MTEQNISRRKFTKTLSEEEIAPYVKWGGPFLVRDTGANGLGKYELSRPLRATAFMSCYGLDYRLQAEQLDTLVGLLKRNNIKFEQHGTNLQVLINEVNGIITLEVDTILTGKNN